MITLERDGSQWKKLVLPEVLELRFQIRMEIEFRSYIFEHGLAQAAYGVEHHAHCGGNIPTELGATTTVKDAAQVVSYRIGDSAYALFYQADNHA